MESIKAPRSKGRVIALYVGAGMLAIWLIANALPTYTVIQNMSEVPNYGMGFLISFFAVIGGCVAAIIYGLKKP